MAEVSRTGGVDARAAYLDLCDPGLTAVAEQGRDGGWTRAVVVPLLFTQAFHARVDVPEAVSAAADETGLTLVVADILGTQDDLVAVLADVLRDRAVPEDTPVLLFAVGSSDPDANAAVHDLAARVGTTRSGAVRAAFATAEPRPDPVLAELGIPQPSPAELSPAELKPADFDGSARPDPPLAILPLFVSPGRLLDLWAARAEQAGWLIADPLETRLAPVVLDRFRRALALDADSRPIT